ncbi:MAG TPA: hypothetical protein VG844_09870, partial [Terracidiphilus sp.]|nr:hypothetical protein [Terracidiphilus sp.]
MSRLNALACCFFCLLFTGHNRAYASQQNGSDQSTNQGISAESAIKVSDEELAQHFQGKWPILHVDRSQVEKDWPSMTAFDFDVTVSDKG